MATSESKPAVGGGLSDLNYCVYPFSENLFYGGLERPTGI